MHVLFMDTHVLVTKCCSYPCIHECFHLHLLHCIHCIASVQGESQLQGELKVCLGLMCACANKGENFWEKWSNKGETCLILVLRVHHFGRIARVRGNAFQGSFCFGCGSWFPHFPSASCMTASSVTSVFEESCFWLLIDCVEPLPLS